MFHRRGVVRLAGIATVLAGRGLSLLGACAPADVAVEHGKIVTMDGERRIVSALAIRDGRILAAGSEVEITGCLTPQTTVIDLRGKTVLPGLIDVHTHALEWGRGIVSKQIDASYPAVHSIAEIVEQIRQRALTSKPGEWIFGSGWDDAKLAEHRYLRRQDFDQVAPNNPVYLIHVSGHLGVANSAAMKVAGIDRETANPDGGIVEHDSEGEPTGVVKDNAMRLVGSKLPAPTPELLEQAAKQVSDSAASLGLTTIHDVWGGAGPGKSAARFTAYQQAYARGWLKIRVHLAPGVSSIAEAEALANGGLYTGFGNDHLKLGAAKMFADGGMGARTIAIFDPPLEEPDGKTNYGLLLWKPEEMKKAQMILAAAGWQISTHAIGDRAMDEVLDAYESTQNSLHLKDARFRIIHGGLSTPPILKRLRDLKVCVDSDPSFVYWIGSWFEKYGGERTRWAYPGKSYFDNGIVNGGGSDVPVTPMSPWWGIWAAVARKELKSGKVLAPEERVSVMQAIEIFTRNGAYISFDEKNKGSLETGKLADFIVVDRDVMTVPADELKDVNVLQTFVDGKLIYDRNSSSK